MTVQLLRLVLQQSYFGTICNNVFHYTVDNTETDNAEYLASRFEAVNVPGINAIQAISANNVNLYVANLSNVADYWTEGLSGAGAIGAGSASQARFDAHGMTFTVSPSAIRHGYKRFVGVDESQCQAGTYTSAAQTAVDALAVALCANLTISARVFTPVVARVLSVDPTLTYLVATLLGRLVCRLTTQNTRK